MIVRYNCFETNSSSTQDYLDYLTLVDTIKSNVKADLG